MEDYITRSEFEQLRSQVRQQQYGGFDGQHVDIQYLLGFFKTTSDSIEFNRITDTTARVPSNISEQVFIYNNGGTFKLYVYDSIGKVWKSVTIA